MTIGMMLQSDILKAVEERRQIVAAVRREEVLPLLLEATGRQYAASAMTQKRAIRARAHNGVRIIVAWLWDVAFLHVIPGNGHTADFPVTIFDTVADHSAVQRA